MSDRVTTKKATTKDLEEAIEDLFPKYLKGEVSKAGWSIQFVKQTEDYVWFKVSCKNKDRQWFTIKVKCPKKKFRSTG